MDWDRYLADISRIPLLSRAEVHDAAERYERGEVARARLASSEPMSRDVADSLARDVADGGHAKHLLVTSNLRLVVAIARRYRRRDMIALSDLVQEGVFGLIRAVEKFDHRCGNTFSTYATWWIRQAISRALAEQARSVRVPKHISDQVSGCLRVRDELRGRLGHEPSVRELAAATGYDEARVAVLLRCAAPAQPLHLVDEASRYGERTDAEPEQQAIATIERQQLRERLGAALARLPASHQALVCERVGWRDGTPHSLRTVADERGISPDLARRMERDALAMLRRQPQVDGLQEWLGS